MMMTNFLKQQGSTGDSNNLIEDPGQASVSNANMAVPSALSILTPGMSKSVGSEKDPSAADLTPLMSDQGNDSSSQGEGSSPPPTPDPRESKQEDLTQDSAGKPAAGGRPEKIKLPPYLEREITIKDTTKVEANELLVLMKSGFERKYKQWSQATTKFKAANLLVTLVVISIQVAQVIIFQVPSLENSPTRTALSTILPAITGAVLAVQLKLSWAEKGYKAKTNANLYHQLLKHMEYRLNMIQAHGELVELDAVKIWNTALQAETKHVPAFLSCC